MARRVPLWWAWPYESAAPGMDSRMPSRSGALPAAAAGSSFWPQPASVTTAAIEAAARVREENWIMVSSLKSSEWECRTAARPAWQLSAFHAEVGLAHQVAAQQGLGIVGTDDLAEIGRAHV